MQFSDNVAFLEPSATLALAARARRLAAEGRSIVDLSSGEPAYPPPGYVLRAATEALRAGHTGYPPTQGIPELREAVARYLGSTTRHGDASADRVLVSAGVKQALFNCLYCLFQDGDEILVPVPYWPTYPAAVRLTEATPVFVPTRWEDDFRLDPEALERHRTRRTRALLLNSPGNPTGAVQPRRLLADLLAWCGEHDIWVLSDEIYRRLCYVEDRAPSVFDVADRPERVVLLTGASKSFCMPGFRIGFAVGPAELVRRASDLQSQTTSGAATPSQHAAAAAYGQEEAREAAVREMVERLAGLREMATEALRDVDGLEAPAPDGAIYMYARLADEGADSAEVAERLLADAGVACVPGDAFGHPGHLRFNLAVQPSTLEEGLGRIRAFFGSRGG